MSAPTRKREVQLNFRVSPEELALIEQKMAQLGTKNREAYLRKMALDGYVVRLELPELKELVSLMRYSSNNLNQLARRVHETGRIYDADLEDISRRQEALWDGVHRILTSWQSCRDRGIRPGFEGGPACACGCARPPFFSLPVSLHFCGPQAIMESETEVKADVDI